MNNVGRRFPGSIVTRSSPSCSAKSVFVMEAQCLSCEKLEWGGCHCPRVMVPCAKSHHRALNRKHKKAHGQQIILFNWEHSKKHSFTPNCKPLWEREKHFYEISQVTPSKSRCAFFSLASWWGSCPSILMACVVLPRPSWRGGTASGVAMSALSAYCLLLLLPGPALPFPSRYAALQISSFVGTLQYIGRLLFTDQMSSGSWGAVFFPNSSSKCSTYLLFCHFSQAIGLPL